MGSAHDGASNRRTPDELEPYVRIPLPANPQLDSCVFLCDQRTGRSYRELATKWPMNGRPDELYNDARERPDFCNKP
jgi:hypothetical protein